MATFNFVNDFFERLGKKEIDLDGDTIKVYLTNATPSAASTVKADLAEITQEHGYDGPADISNAYTESGGVGTLTATDKTWTPSGGSFGPFRYAIFYVEEHASDALIGWVDFGSEITATETPVLTPIKVGFGASLLTIALAT